MRGGRYRIIDATRPSGLGDLVSRDSIVNDLRSIHDASATRFGNLAADAVNGRIAPATFNEIMKFELKDLYNSTSALARGGWSQMDAAAWGRNGQILRGEYGHLAGFAQDIADGNLTAAQAAARAKIYAGKAYSRYWAEDLLRQQARGEYKEARWNDTGDSAECHDCERLAAMGWVPLGAHGTVPGAGDTDCLGACRCDLEYRAAPVVNYDASQPRDPAGTATGGQWTDDNTKINASEWPVLDTSSGEIAGIPVTVYRHDIPISKFGRQTLSFDEGVGLIVHAGKNPSDEQFSDQLEIWLTGADYLPPDGTFYRYTNNREEIGLLTRGELRASRDQRDGTSEEGLSVSRHGAYALFGYKYGYVVTGDIRRLGSDGEPVLEMSTIRPLSKLKSSNKIADEFSKSQKESRSKFAIRHGITEDQITKLRSFAINRTSLRKTIKGWSSW